MAFDFVRACRAFEEYLDEYDREADKVKLKIVHTYGVVSASKAIGMRMNLSREDMEIAETIALLHDIGRFEQIRLFDSFLPDTMDHAAYGTELLFGSRKMIRRFVTDDRYDEIIREAIAWHSSFALKEIADERTLFHAKLIRDADKLDNCRVKIEEPVETLLGVSEEDAGEGLISPKVWNSCMKKESVLSCDRVTKADYWVSYIAQYFNIYFPETCAIIKERNYIRQIAERLVYKEADTREKIMALTGEMESYMEQRIC